MAEHTHALLSSVTGVVSVVVNCPVTKKGANIFSFGDEKETEEEWRPGPGGGLAWGEEGNIVLSLFLPEEPRGEA